MSLHDPDTVQSPTRRPPSPTTCHLHPLRTATPHRKSPVRLLRDLSSLPTYTKSSWFDPPVEITAPLGWLVKDAFWSSSSGLAFDRTWDEAVRAFATTADCRHERGHGAAPMESVIQPLVAGQEYNVDVFLDLAGARVGTLRQEEDQDAQR